MYCRKGLKIPPLIRGGGQEDGLRSGTEATAQIAAFAAAARLGAETLTQDLRHMEELRAYAVERLTREVPQLRVLTQTGAPHILPITLPGYKSEVVVRFLSDQGIYVSSGSACHKGKPSHVYAALKLPKKEQDGVLRVSFSYDTTREDIDALSEGLRAAEEQLFTSLS
jgi:cysteine desulfurase